MPTSSSFPLAAFANILLILNVRVSKLVFQEENKILFSPPLLLFYFFLSVFSIFLFLRCSRRSGLRHRVLHAIIRALLFSETHKMLVKRSTYLICMYVHMYVYTYILLKIIHSFKALFLCVKLALIYTDCCRPFLCTVLLVSRRASYYQDTLF
jgi:hypothetical protein